MVNCSPFGDDANRPFVAAEATRCSWIGCSGRSVSEDLPICFHHGMQVLCGMVQWNATQQRKPDDADEWPLYDEPTYIRTHPQSVVYYLMLSPLTVKIGTSKNLANRLGAFRIHPQYVVALEVGDMKLEHERHRQFADERDGRLENFHLSERLRQHITELAPHRDEMMTLACPSGYSE